VTAFPFLAVVSAATGAGGVRQAIITRMGLNAQASRDVEGLIVSGREISTLTAFSAILLVLGAIGMAGTLQGWYQKIYDQPSSRSVLKHLAYQVVGVVAFTVYISATVFVLHEVRHAGRLLVLALTFVFSVLFWWCTAYFSCIADWDGDRCFPPAWRPVPLLPVSECSLRCSSQT